ncbi:hypothetical protein KVV02_006412 [Mortierella alpina]|uniref:Phosphatidylglycerol/phosphatidylinositol transfer protein n=1 Tax=Mortierella alpina TaxID=64518 RepID=A0A9P8I9L0_MORAP|nr:hypothetical protein KVV02_006412 [Mortierella alpina]
MKFFAGVALVALATSSALAVDLSNCGTDTDTFKLTSLSISPDPPNVREKACITIKGTLNKEITTSATMKVAGDLGALHVDQVLNLCQMLQEAGITCPVPTTTTELKYCADTSFLPSDVPINLHVEAADTDSPHLFCFSAQLTIQA